MLAFLEKLIIYRYQITLKVEKGGQLPGFIGSGLRGAIGWALLRQNCRNLKTPDFSCGHNCRCIMERIWSPIVRFPSGYGRRYEKDPPKPYLVQTDFNELPRIWKQGEYLTFNFCLIGKPLGTTFFTHVLPAIDEAVKCLGERKLIFSIQKVECSVLDFSNNKHENYDSLSDYLTMSTITPIKIFEKNNLAEKLHFGLLIKHLIERARNLSYLYCGAQWVDEDELTQFVIRAEHQVKWLNQNLSDTETPRQGGKPVIGWVGSVRFKGDWAEYEPLLQLAEWLNIGKLADMGFGRVQFDR
jgi:hypothetical protein